MQPRNGAAGRRWRGARRSKSAAKATSPTYSEPTPATAASSDQVFDYTRQDFTRSDQRFDLLLDIASSRSWRDVRRILKPDATLVIIGGPKSNRLIGPLGHVIQMRLGSLRASQKVIFFIANFNRQDFELLKGYLETDLKPVVQAAYPFGETAEAIRLLGTGHAWGKIVVTVQGSS